MSPETITLTRRKEVGISLLSNKICVILENILKLEFLK